MMNTRTYNMITLFQTATGAWHWPSILTVLGWFVGFLVAGGFMFGNLAINRRERVAAYQKEIKSAADAGELQKKVIEAEAKAEDARQRTAWRTLSNNQKEIIRAQLKQFAGYSLEMAYSAQDPECDAYASEFEQVLHEVGINISQANAVISTVSIIGIQVHVRDGKTPPPLANALLATFQSAGIHAQGVQNPTWPESQANLVKLHIGSKPRH